MLHCESVHLSHTGVYAHGAAGAGQWQRLCQHPHSGSSTFHVKHRFDVQAFTRTVQQEPDNGDAWADIAAVHLQHQRWAPAFKAAAEVLFRSVVGLLCHKRSCDKIAANKRHAAPHLACMFSMCCHGRDR